VTRARAFAAAAAVVGSCLGAGEAFAQAGAPPATIVSWTLEAPPAIDGSAAAPVTVRAEIKPGWKVYAMSQAVEGPRPLRVRVADATFVIDGPVTSAPPPKKAHDATWLAEVSYHDGTFSLSVPLRPTATTRGDVTLRVAVRYQACSEDLCLKPTEIALQAPIAVR
jgi:DsbC/DsbD-like thiol-disulfide interchange protein